MFIKKILQQLNIFAQCRLFGLSLCHSPQFLFLMMGLIIIIASIISYLLGTRYIADPGLVAFIVIIVSAILFIIAFIITQSFERLAEISQMKSEFINIISHQLRSPLTNIKWIAGSLTSKSVKITSGEEKEYFGYLSENINRMARLIDELLIASGIERGIFSVRKREVSSEDLIRELIVRSKAFAETSNVEVKFYPQKDIPKVFFDSTLIKLAVGNLLDNAIRYSKEGGGKVEIRLEKREKNLHFEIKDTGIGIPKENQKYMFQKFFRGENIAREQTQGGGLGLYIAKSIIEKSGGKIWFKSEEGKGTTFYFTLPIR